MLAFVIYKTIWRFSTIICCHDRSIRKNLAFAVTAVFIRRMRIVEVLPYGSPVSRNVSVAIVTTNTRLSKSVMDGVCDNAILAFLQILHIDWHLASTIQITQLIEHIVQYKRILSAIFKINNEKFGAINFIKRVFSTTKSVLFNP